MGVSPCDIVEELCRKLGAAGFSFDDESRDFNELVMEALDGIDVVASSEPTRQKMIDEVLAARVKMFQRDMENDVEGLSTWLHEVLRYGYQGLEELSYRQLCKEYDMWVGEED